MRMIAISKITSKGRTTVPQAVRIALKTKPGDLIAWEIDARGNVGVRGMQAADLEQLKAVEGTLTEWRTAADEEAYGKLARTAAADAVRAKLAALDLSERDVSDAVAWARKSGGKTGR
jgi:antitoxin PrlF